VDLIRLNAKMNKHVKNYFKAFGYTVGDFIPCEACGKESVDIHHIEPRSKYGSKKKMEQDAPGNLIALCRECHDKAHGPDSRTEKERFKELVKCRAGRLGVF
jgi:hypothetical protein